MLFYDALILLLILIAVTARLLKSRQVVPLVKPVFLDLEFRNQLIAINELINKQISSGSDETTGLKAIVNYMQENCVSSEFGIVLVANTRVVGLEKNFRLHHLLERELGIWKALGEPHLDFIDFFRKENSTELGFLAIDMQEVLRSQVWGQVVLVAVSKLNCESGASVSTFMAIGRVAIASWLEQSQLGAVGISRDFENAQLGHDLRAPIANLKAALQLILQEARDNAIAELSEVGLITCDQLRLMVDNFLDLLSSTELREQKKEYFSLADLASAVLSEFYAHAKYKNLWLKFKDETGAAGVYAERREIRRVLINLISNAIKYTTEGGVSLGLVFIHNKVIELYVEDTGSGVAANELNLSTKNISDSFGLGLLTTEKLLKRNDSQLTYRIAKSGKGSRFSFTLDSDLLSQNQ